MRGEKGEYERKSKGEMEENGGKWGIWGLGRNLEEFGGRKKENGSDLARFSIKCAPEGPKNFAAASAKGASPSRRRFSA